MFHIFKYNVNMYMIVKNSFKELVVRVRTYEEIIDSNEDVIFIDLRTEKEFEAETVPNAVNIPVFSNEERAIVGTLYKKESPKIATEAAVKFVSKKLPEIFDKINDLDKQRKTLVFFCARGGMRSSSVVGLFTGLKFNVAKLDFGYKGYRDYVNKNLEKEFEKISLVTLYGKTGTGKTRVLHEIEKLGYDVLDLEGAANHRGSILGAIGLSKIQSQKKFEGDIFYKLQHRKSNIIFTEGESKRIGNIVMKNYMYDKLLNSRKILIEASLPFRVNVIKEEYINESFEKEDLIISIEKLRRYINKEKIQLLLSAIEKNDYDYVIEELMVNYYDKNYNCNDKDYEMTLENNNSVDLAKKIVSIFSNK